MTRDRWRSTCSTDRPTHALGVAVPVGHRRAAPRLAASCKTPKGEPNSARWPTSARRLSSGGQRTSWCSRRSSRPPPAPRPEVGPSTAATANRCNVIRNVGRTRSSSAVTSPTAPRNSPSQDVTPGDPRASGTCGRCSVARTSIRRTGPGAGDFMSGNLCHQIEHHLFLDLPATGSPDLRAGAGTLPTSTTCPPPVRSWCSTSDLADHRQAVASGQVPDGDPTTRRKPPQTSGSGDAPRVCACTAPSIRPPAAGAERSAIASPGARARKSGHRHPHRRLSVCQPS